MDSALQKAVDIIIKVADPDKIILFGSHARGDNRKDSDYDLCVLKQNVEHRRKLAQKIYLSLCDVSTPIDVIVQTPERFDELKNQSFMVYKEIAKDGVVIYEKSGQS